MPTTTGHREWYTINGTDFATYGYWISEIDRGVAGRKGNDIDVPAIYGSAWREKRLATRTENWNIIITDAHPTTGVVATTNEARRSQFNANYDAVMTILNNPAQQLTIIYNRINTSASATTDTRYAYGEVVSAFTVRDHREIGYTEISVDVMFADPRWYDAPGTLTSLSTTISTAVTSQAISNTAASFGSATATLMTVTFTSTTVALVNPRLTNSTYTTQSIIGYTGTVASGTSVVIDTDNLTCKSGTGTNLISGLYRSGSRQDWMALFPTTNTLTFSQNASTGRGTCAISFRKVYI